MSGRRGHIRSCCAAGCTSKSYRLLVNGERVKYFPFPLDDDYLCSRWAKVLQIKEPPENYHKLFVCTKHFQESELKYDKSGKWHVRRGAIPSLENLYPTPVKKPPKPKPKYSEDEDWDLTETDSEDSNTEEESETKSVTEEKNDTIFKDVAGLEDNVPLKDIPIVGKKVAVKIRQLLKSGLKPYPWESTSLSDWMTQRLQAHEEQIQRLDKVIESRESIIKQLESITEQQMYVLTHLLVKKYSGNRNMTDFLSIVD